MVKIYLLRHCETTHNVDGFYYTKGSRTKFSQRGLLQLDAIKKYFSNKNIPSIFSSTAQRCQITAQQVRDNFISVKELEDLYQGDFSGLSRGELMKLHPEFYEKRKQNMYEIASPNGESFKDVEKRVANWFDKQSFTQDTLIATHASCVLMLIKHLCGWDFAKAKNTFVSPASLTIFNYENNTFTLEQEPTALLEADYANLTKHMTKVE